MKLIYDTKELSIQILEDLRIPNIKNSPYLGQMSATRESYHNDNDYNQKQAILDNIHDRNNCLIRNVFVAEVEGKLFLLDGGMAINTLKDFLNDKICAENIIGNNDIVAPKYSELKSAQKRRFRDFTFRTIVIEVKDMQELELIINQIKLVF
jgi:hypothetical protein